MADRVFFANNDFISPPSGFNGLPFQISQIDAPYLAEYPVTFPDYNPPDSFDDVLSLVWRWKTLRATVNLTIFREDFNHEDGEDSGNWLDPDNNPASGPDYSESPTYTFDLQHIYSRERDICITGPAFGGGYVDTATHGYDEINMALTMGEDVAPILGSDSGATKLAVAFNLQVVSHWPILLGGFQLDLRDNIPAGPTPAEVGTLTITIPSGSTHSAPIYGYIVDSNPEVTCNILMVVTEFWPYANSEGLPIWDTASGSLLRDPML